jgi:hypothetical protein
MQAQDHDPAMPASLASRATMSPIPASSSRPPWSPCSSSSTSQPTRRRAATPTKLPLPAWCRRWCGRHQWRSAGHHMGRAEARACLWQPLNRIPRSRRRADDRKAASCLTNTFMEDGPTVFAYASRLGAGPVSRCPWPANAHGRARYEASRLVFVLMCPCAQLWACTRERSKTRVRG